MINEQSVLENLDLYFDAILLCLSCHLVCQILKLMNK